jgi:DNA-binding CsgD family transcriptional regulator
METQTITEVLQPTESEKEWVRLLATGEKANDVAQKLNLNKNTFAYHLRFLRTKYNCKNTRQLVSLFLRNRFID